MSNSSAVLFTFIIDDDLFRWLVAATLNFSNLSTSEFIH